MLHCKMPIRNHKMFVVLNKKLGVRADTYGAGYQRAYPVTGFSIHSAWKCRSGSFSILMHYYLMPLRFPPFKSVCLTNALVRACIEMRREYNFLFANKGVHKRQNGTITITCVDASSDPRWSGCVSGAHFASLTVCPLAFGVCNKPNNKFALHTERLCGWMWIAIAGSHVYGSC